MCKEKLCHLHYSPFSKPNVLSSFLTLWMRQAYIYIRLIFTSRECEWCIYTPVLYIFWHILLPDLAIASSPGPGQKWQKGLVTVAKIPICAMSAVFVWSRGIMFVQYQLLHSWHMKVVDSFKDQVKMETRLGDICKPRLLEMYSVFMLARLLNTLAPQDWPVFTP